MVAPTLFSSDLLWAPLPLFLMQILIILVLVRILGRALLYLNQPMVIGEIIAGVVLGPSVLGYIPGFSDTLFPADSLENLTLFSSVGLCFFMFFLGLEVDPVFMMQSWRTTIPIALTSMSIPFGVGCAVATWLWGLETSTEQPANKLAFMLFIGVVFAFSAFPVLARILDASRLITSPVGIQALGLAAVEDVTAWCVLALIISYAATPGGDSPDPGTPGGDLNPPGNSWNSALIFAVLVVYIAFLMAIVRPLLARAYQYKIRQGADLNTQFVPYLFFGLLISSWFTEVLGIHAFFGAFLFGCVIPKEGDLIPILAPRIELLIVHVFLPIYFANSGMKTQLSTLNTSRAWMFTMIVICLASLSKITSVTLSAKVVLTLRRERIKVYLAHRKLSLEEEARQRVLTQRGFSDSLESDVMASYAEQEDGETSEHDAWSEAGEDRLNAVNMQEGTRVSNSDHRDQRVGSLEGEVQDKMLLAPANPVSVETNPLPPSGVPASAKRTSPPKAYPATVPNPASPLTGSPSSDPFAPALLSSSSYLGVGSIMRALSPVAQGSSPGASSPPPIAAAVTNSTATRALSPAAPTTSPPPPHQHVPRPAGLHGGSHANRTHAIEVSDDSFIVAEDDRDEFGLDVRTGLPLMSRDQALINEFEMSSWAHCLTLGVLLNSRGLVALIVLNIGLDKRVIGPEIFSMMLTMSMVCTCITSPVIFALYGHRWQRALLMMQKRDMEEEQRAQEEEREQQILDKVSDLIQGVATGGVTADHLSPEEAVAAQEAQEQAQELQAHLASILARERRPSAEGTKAPGFSEALSAGLGDPSSDLNAPLLDSGSEIQSGLAPSEQVSSSIAIPSARPRLNRASTIAHTRRRLETDADAYADAMESSNRFAPGSAEGWERGPGGAYIPPHFLPPKSARFLGVTDGGSDSDPSASPSALGATPGSSVGSEGDPTGHLSSFHAHMRANSIAGGAAPGRLGHFAAPQLRNASEDLRSRSRSPDRTPAQPVAQPPSFGRERSFSSAASVSPRDRAPYLADLYGDATGSPRRRKSSILTGGDTDQLNLLRRKTSIFNQPVLPLMVSPNSSSASVEASRSISTRNLLTQVTGQSGSGVQSLLSPRRPGRSRATSRAAPQISPRAGGQPAAPSDDDPTVPSHQWQRAFNFARAINAVSSPRTVNRSSSRYHTERIDRSSRVNSMTSHNGSYIPPPTSIPAGTPVSSNSNAARPADSDAH